MVQDVDFSRLLGFMLQPNLRGLIYRASIKPWSVPEYSRSRSLLEKVAAEQAKAIDIEIAELEVEAERLKVEIKELAGTNDQAIE